MNDDEMVALYHDYGDQLEITPELRDGKIEIVARPRTREPVATGKDPAELRAKLEAAGYQPWR